MTIEGADMSSAASRVANSLALPSTARNKVAASSAGAPANATGTASTSATTDGGTQITSADFLTLLVTEMKNQDPTQPTDPNAYIQQLVGVNSLQQLIAINGDLSGLNSTSASSGASPQTVNNTSAATSVI